ncbi:MAG: DUF1330 domain-containing protein [Thermomicrobiales bacterium]|nr:DUF1330 domain-containing protein [Thermomicrobiales bacterium]
MAAYLVVDTDWNETDLETRQAFGRAAQPVIARFGGTFLTPPGRPSETLEGDWEPKVLSIIAFPDVAAARALWNAPEFRDAVAIRKATNAVFKIALVDAAPAEAARAVSQ